jgi:hypothetical protein
MVHTMATAFVTTFGSICSTCQRVNSALVDAGRDCTFDTGATAANSFFSASLQKDARRKVQ